MTVYATTAEEQINAAQGRDLVLITLALCLEILCHTVENVDVLCGNVDVVEEIIVHEVPVALVMLAGQTYVLVHIEGHNVLEGDLARLIHFNESLVNAKGRRARGKTEHERTVLLMVVDGVRNMLRRPLTHRIVIVFDD